MSATIQAMPAAAPAYDPSSLAQLRFACLLPPTKEYATVINLFPGNYAHTPWGTHGSFFVTLTAYVEGKEVAKIHSKHITKSPEMHVREQGNIRVNLDDLTDFLPAGIEGMCILDFHHAREIPVDAYLSHIHRQTGVYVAYPGLPFVGDVLYPTTHTQQLENTLFWPGLLPNKHMLMSVAVANPFPLVMGYQVHLFRADGTKEQSEVFRLKTCTMAIHSLEELFPEGMAAVGPDGRSAVCVAAQYKLIAYMVVRDRATGIISTLDHMHTYCLF